MMKLNRWVAALFVAVTAIAAPTAIAAQSAQAQPLPLTLKGTIKGASPLPTSIFVMPIGGQGRDSIVVSKGKVVGTVAASLRGLSCFVGVANRRQLILPVWLDGKTRLRLSLDANGCLTNKTDADNRALSAFNEDVYRRSRTLWERGQQITPDREKVIAGGYLTVADSLITVLRPNAAVTSYLRAWAYTSAAGFWITRYPKDPLPWTDGQTVLDNAVAATFYDTPRIILHTLPHDSLGARLAYLYDHYQTGALRRRVGTTLVQQFIRQYDYAKDYVSGLRQVREAVEKYQLPESLVNDFTARLSTVSGQPFPEVVVLKDSLGQTFDFASLKGRYVYIDLWASWCVPCIKEIPSLRKLEAACKDLPVAFVSISIDQSREAWLRRKRSLGLTGLQLHDANGRLAEALNVSGIPHFLVYDKQGRLLVYDAPRPSSPEALMLLKGLK